HTNSEPVQAQQPPRRPVESTLAWPRVAREVLMRVHSIRFVLATAFLIQFSADASVAGASPLRFEVSVPDRFATEPLDGRVLLMLSTTDEKEPRFLIQEGVNSQQIFGVDANDFRPASPVIIDHTALGYPLECLAAVPVGDYFVQALLHRYETFHRADGH